MKKPIAILLLCVAILLMLGTVALYSSTTHQPSLSRLRQHLCWMGLGMASCGLVSLADYSWLRKFQAPKWLLGLSIILLLAVFLPGIGVTKNGAFRWLLFGQPSELAKLALIVFLADYAATHQARMNERYAAFARPGLIAGLVIGLVFIEPDWGTATLMATITLAMLILAGAPWRYVVPATIVGLLTFSLLLLNNPLRLERTLVFRDPERYQDGIGWQGWHSVLSLGTGGWLGVFFGEGSHKNGFVPEQPTDFVLSLIGEEAGFLGTLLVLLLFSGILLCGMRIAWRIADPFGQLLASGITVLIAVQAFINIGVVTSSLPNKGIPLPFVSYGGSNLVCLLTSLGLLVSVARHGPLGATAPAKNPFTMRTKPKVGGPIGSLLYSSMQKPPTSFWKRLVRRMRFRRNSRFPSVALHRYQRVPHRKLTPHSGLVRGTFPTRS